MVKIEKHKSVKSVKSVVKKGFVYLVGAGPGRIDLITVRGAEVLRLADCVICDKLANPALLNLVPKNAEIISVPKRTPAGGFSQEEINKLLVEKASGGKTVVRLKGGDPCIFGRCAEEAAVLADAGIDFEIVPGVTAGIAAAGYTGILLTDRQYNSQVVFVTGQEAEGKQQSNIDWNWLAKFQGTIVFYMGMGNLDFITGRLMENGSAADTPAAVIADTTLPTQRVVKAPLGRLSEKCKEEKIEPPAIIIIGAAANSDARLDWFAKKPLFGKNIVVTRDVCGNAAFAARIACRGGNPIEFPTMKIKPLTEKNEFLRAVARLQRAEFDWVIFTSTNGVSIFFETLQRLGKDARIFGSARIAAIGSETAAKLSEFGIKADFVPTVYTGEQLGKQLMCFTSLRDKKILLLRSQISSMELVELLEQAGADVLNVAIYTAVEQKSETGRLIEKIGRGEIDWLTFASPSSVRMFFEQVPIGVVNSGNARVASIGPTTSEQLKSL
ncbi:MAG: uroporphyrinogen-III C-methyltransferase, partial [Sedimentisphaerales bacterium]|nr:uroporphyrinogen-III C-methyltransferase [Sedimentisphaerales bacterium]